MNTHNRDRLEDIEALIKESAALRSKMDGMAADKERIRSCCVQAIDDAVDTIEAVADVVRRGGFTARQAYAGYCSYEICGTGGERFDLYYRDAGDI